MKNFINCVCAVLHGYLLFVGALATAFLALYAFTTLDILICILFSIVAAIVTTIAIWG